MRLRRLYYRLPPKLRLLARKMVYGPLDIFRRETYANGLPVPPRSLIFTGSGDFKETGLRFVSYFKNWGLRPESCVLDVGSGMGRMALPLTDYLTGPYQGLDIMPIGINWCLKHITTAYPNFHFDLIDAHNDLYTKSGADASGITFPVVDASIDFTFLISVFTHMIPGELEHYAEEIHRSLVSGGICFATFFIYKEESQLSSNNFETFIKQDERYALMDEEVVSANVAYAQSYLQTMLKGKGFEILGESRGRWKDSNGKEDFQDYLVLRKS